MQRKPPSRKPPAADLLALLTEGAACHNRGELQEAERKYRAVLARDPRHFDALHLLGTARAQSGAAEEGVTLISRALAIKPNAAEAHNNLGYALKALGRAAEAVECYRKAVALKPDYVDAHKNLGEALVALKRGGDAIESLRRVAAARPGVQALCNLGYAYRQAGRRDEAVASYRQALEAEPGSARAQCGLGNALLEAGRAEEALEAYDRALAIEPRYADAYSNRGNALVALGRPGEAQADYREALAINPGLVEAHYNLGNALRTAGLADEAMASYRRALADDPRHVEAWNNLGTALLELGRAREADEMFGRALEIDPRCVEAHVNRGNALLARHRNADAADSYRRAIEARPGFAEAHNSLGNVLRTAGHHAEAAACFEAALALNPAQPYALGALTGCVAYLCDWQRLPGLVRRVVDGVRAGEPVANPFGFFGLSGDPADQRACAEAYVRRRHPESAAPLWRGERYRHERIRVAYLSADFREHAVAWLIAGLIERHDRLRFEVYGISFGPAGPSPMRERLKAGFEHFIDVSARGDAEIAALLRESEIDIAVDLMGHTLNSRAGIFARRPAPAQVSYLGFPATTGAAYIDYLLADSFLAPDEEAPHYSERIVRLPDTFQVNDAKRRIAERTPPRAEVGLPEGGFVYCCFNSPHKITPSIFDAWMRVLRAVEGSVLWLLERSDAAPAHLRREAQVRGVAPERLVFAPRVQHADYLARYRLADLFLDTLPFNAGTTASDALWAGLPVLTCAGRAFASRMAGSLLHAVGLPELITLSLADYEALAIRLAREPGALRALRDRLAENRKTAPLFDTDRFRRNVESAYRTMWEITQRGEPPRSFTVGPAAASDPKEAKTLLAEGNALAAQGRAGEAAERFRALVALAPGMTGAHYNLGNALAGMGAAGAAIESYRAALAINPRHMGAYNNLGSALLTLKRFEEARAAFDQALAIDPGNADAHNNRGIALAAEGRDEEAIESHRRANAIRPGHADTLHRLGNRLQAGRRYGEAQASFDALLAIDPDFPNAAGMGAYCAAHVCDWRGRPAAVERLIDGVRAGATVAQPLNLLPFSDDPADQLACSAIYARRWHSAAEPLWRGERYRHERIRIAYLSGDFRDHAAAWLIAELIERHDRGRFDVTGISFGPDTRDAMRARLQAGFERFMDVRTKSDDEVAAWLRGAEIDIAVDLMGYTQHMRPGILARRPAPVQVNYLGYPGTMGAEFMDYILADRFVIPAGARPHYAEQVAYLPDSYVAGDTTRKVGLAPARAEAGLPERGIVYCCFHNGYKINPGIFDVWMRILRAVEGAVLWLSVREPAAADNLRREAGARGVAPERLCFSRRARQEDYLARFRVADLFLDTPVYNAHSTAVDALWGGIPVLTCPGRSFASRVAGSLLHAVGLPELVTLSLADYEALAIRLAREPGALRALRDRLAENRKTAPLFETDRFRRHVEAAYRTMWEIAQRGESPRSFSVGTEASGSSLSSTTGTR